MSKEEKQEFVSGLHGTTLLEIQMVMTFNLFSYLFWKLTSKRFYSFPFYIDFMFLVLPILVNSTLTEYSFQFAVLQLLLALGCNLYDCLVGKLNKKHGNSKNPNQQSNVNVRGSITAFRGYLQFMTICAILAVDFHVFPRRFAKTETFGTSLMDLGVGGFVFSSGLVAGPKLLSSTSSPRVWDSLKPTFLALLIGLARILFVKISDYQEHVSEYGVHWNFFFTLGLIPLLFSLQRQLISIQYPFLWAILFMSLYSIALVNGLQDFILNGQRTNLFNMNREGIFSLIGYYTLFLISLEVGNVLLSPRKSQKYKMMYLTSLLGIGQILFYLAIYVFDMKVSRRLTNAPYVLWVLNVSLYYLLGIIAVDYIFPSLYLPYLFESCNKNQLVVFLIANVMTGLINMSMNTLVIGNFKALGILVIYLWIISKTACILSNFKLKF